MKIDKANINAMLRGPAWYNATRFTKRGTESTDTFSAIRVPPVEPATGNLDLCVDTKQLQTVKLKSDATVTCVPAGLQIQTGMTQTVVPVEDVTFTFPELDRVYPAAAPNRTPAFDAVRLVSLLESIILVCKTRGHVPRVRLAWDDETEAVAVRIVGNPMPEFLACLMPVKAKE